MSKEIVLTWCDGKHFDFHRNIGKEKNHWDCAPFVHIIRSLQLPLGSGSQWFAKFIVAHILWGKTFQVELEHYVRHDSFQNKNRLKGFDDYFIEKYEEVFL